MSKKMILESGKRKRAIARASLKQGKGIVTVNGVLLDIYEPRMARLRIQEPLILAGSKAQLVDIKVMVNSPNNLLKF